PVHLRGTGESVAANIGGRMIGTSFAALTSLLSGLAFIPGGDDPTRVAYTAAGVGCFVYLVNLVASFLLPEPKEEMIREWGAAMRIAYITAGAAGTICGSCLHDNTLAAALIAQGHDALLIPTYTPTRTDEPNVSQKRVFFGGINVYLQQKLALFRHTPWLFDRPLDAPGLLRWVSRFAVKTRAEDLAGLTISMLKGEHGCQRKEIDKLVHWLAAEVKPEIINLTAALLTGMVPKL